MDFNSLKLSFDELKAFVEANNLELESSIHEGFSNQQMLEYIKMNIGRVICRPMYYYGNTISAVHVEEIVNGKKNVSYWNVKNVSDK